MAREAKRQALARHYAELGPEGRRLLLQSDVRDEEGADRFMGDLRAAREWKEGRQKAEAAGAGRETAKSALGQAGEVRRELLRRYGARLTPFQRSYILGTDFDSLERGEEVCERFIEANEGAGARER